MKKLIAKLTPIQWLAVALILLGLLLMISKVRGMLSFYRETRYARENHFADGNLSPDLLRPWMSLQYVAAAYDVPQQYVYAALKIQPRKETSMLSLARLNQQMQLGQSDGQPVLLKTMRAIILAYRANPVSPGMLERSPEPWMTVQYIANSTGLAAETIFAEIGVPAQGNAHKPLVFLSDEIHYAGGVKAMTEAIRKVLDAHGIKPAVHP